MRTENSSSKLFEKKRSSKRKKRSDTELLLSIVSGKVSSTRIPDNMQNPNKLYDFDILKTRRLIINDTCNKRQQHPPSSNVNLSHPCSIQFSNTILTQPTIPRFNYTDRSVQNTKKGIQQQIDPRNLSTLKRNKTPHNVITSNDDDVVYLNSSVANNSVNSAKSRSNSFISINDRAGGDDFSNSIIYVDTPDSIPDLNKFSIVVTNTECSTSKVKAANVDDDSVVCLDTDDKEMEWIDDQINAVDGNVITIDDDSDKNDGLGSNSLPFRRLKITKHRSTKHSLIRKKKDIRKKDITHTAKSTRKQITFSEPAPSVSHRSPPVSHTAAPTPPREVEVSKSPKAVTSISENGLVSNVSNMYTSEPISKSGLREIVIDGSNIALGHTNGTSYSIEGLQIVIDYFLKRGHKVRAFVPKFRLIHGRSTNPDHLRRLVNDKLVVLTPSRAVLGRRITPYDDRFIIQYATLCEGIVVSGDSYRDLVNEKPEWRNTIENRILSPTWIDNILMFPEDPLGRFGPSLNDFLKFPTS